VLGFQDSPACPCGKLSIKIRRERSIGGMLPTGENRSTMQVPLGPPQNPQGPNDDPHGWSAVRSR
jgi:hypothetical protein